MLFYFAEGDALDSLVDALRLMQAVQRAIANGSHFTLLLATERTQPPQLDEQLGNGLMNCKNPGWKMLEVPKRPGDPQHQRATIHHLMIFNSLIIHDIYSYIIHSQYRHMFKSCFSSPLQSRHLSTPKFITAVQEDL